jgi:hypothetical protein
LQDMRKYACCQRGAIQDFRIFTRVAARLLKGAGYRLGAMLAYSLAPFSEWNIIEVLIDPYLADTSRI